MYRMLLLIATLIMGVQAAYADVRIGILTPLTGAGSRYGQEQRVAVDMFLGKVQRPRRRRGQACADDLRYAMERHGGYQRDAQAHRFR